MEKGEVEEKTTLCIRVGKYTKAAADRLFRELGLPTSEAINIFLKKCIRMGGIPFEISLGESQEMKKRKEDMNPIDDKKITINEMTTDNKETIIPWFLDYTGTTDLLLEGGVENVKEFFDAIKEYQEELGVKVLITIVTGSARESARAKYIQLQNLAKNYGMPDLFDGVIAEYYGYYINEERNNDKLILPIDRRIEQNRAVIEGLVREYGGKINSKNETYINAIFPKDIERAKLVEFCKMADALINQSDIRTVMSYDKYGKEGDIKEEERSKYNAVRMKVNIYRKKYNVAFVLIGGDSQEEDLMMYTKNKMFFDLAEIGIAFMAPRNLGNLENADKNIIIGNWDNARGIIECARRVIPEIKKRMIKR